MEREFKPGDVVYWLPAGNRNGRRVLVEEIDPEYSFVWGVEVSSRFGLRSRRGVRIGGKKPFWIHNLRVAEVVPASDERVVALQGRLARLRAVVSR